MPFILLILFYYSKGTKPPELNILLLSLLSALLGYAFREYIYFTVKYSPLPTYTSQKNLYVIF
uniref:Uncharacterized protein n=1 Tax=Octopus bimaculoides TaxID=37653 RepID=A0A0L8IJ02_OCTBM